MSCTDCATPPLSWDAFAPYIAPYAKHAPDALMAHTARVTAIEFARTTGALTRELFIDAQAGVSDYPLVVPDCYTITSVKQVCCGGRPLKVFRDRSCCPAHVRGYVFSAPRDLYVYPAPAEDACGAIQVDVAVIPGQDSCTVDPMLYHEYAEIIGDGAVSRLLMMASASWYDPQRANAFLAKFLSGVRQAKMLQVKKRSAEPQYMRGGRFI